MSDFIVNKVKFFDDGRLLIYGGRLSYEHVFKKWANEPDDTPRYSATLLLDKDVHKDAIEKIKKLQAKLEQEYFEGKIPKDKKFMRDGDDTGKPEYENCMYIAASEVKRRPAVIGMKKEELDEDDGKLYSGCYVNMMISPWKQSNKHGKRINANLLAVQLVKQAEAFGETSSKVNVDEDFDEVDDGFDN